MVGTVNIHTRTGNSANVEALVALEKPLSVDLLLGLEKNGAAIEDSC